MGVASGGAALRCGGHFGFVSFVWGGHETRQRNSRPKTSSAHLIHPRRRHHGSLIGNPQPREVHDRGASSEEPSEDHRDGSAATGARATPLQLFSSSSNKAFLFLEKCNDPAASSAPALSVMLPHKHNPPRAHVMGRWSKRAECVPLSTPLHREAHLASDGTRGAPKRNTSLVRGAILDLAARQKSPAPFPELRQVEGFSSRREERARRVHTFPWPE
jgi:hypothetical protein